MTQQTAFPSDEPAFRYTAAMAGTIESRWQEHWEKIGRAHV